MGAHLREDLPAGRELRPLRHVRRRAAPRRVQYKGPPTPRQQQHLAAAAANVGLGMRFFLNRWMTRAHRAARCHLRGEGPACRTTSAAQPADVRAGLSRSSSPPPSPSDEPLTSDSSDLALLGLALSGPCRRSAQSFEGLDSAQLVEEEEARQKTSTTSQEEDEGQEGRRRGSTSDRDLAAHARRDAQPARRTSGARPPTTPLALAAPRRPTLSRRPPRPRPPRAGPASSWISRAKDPRDRADDDASTRWTSPARPPTARSSTSAIDLFKHEQYEQAALAA